MWSIFTDAEQAVAAGVFSVTSVAGYSITKSLVLYGGFLVAMVVVGWLWQRRLAATLGESNLQKEEGFSPHWSKGEWLGLVCVLGITAVLNLVLEQTLFDANALHSEEFYNLAALNELAYRPFSIIYPYSVGHLAAAAGLRSVGIGLIYYKFFLNAAAIILLYACLSVLIPKKTYRWFGLAGFLAVFFLSWVVPTLHANLLRFLLPVIFIFGLFGIYYRYAGQMAKQIAAYTGLWAALLFFGSADNIMIGVTVYGLFCLWQWLRPVSWRAKLWLAAPPVLGIGVMTTLLGTRYLHLLLSQLQSISLYSGHANAMPYFNVMTVFRSVSLHDAAISAAYTIIFYAPFLIMGGLILYGAALWSREKAQRFSAPFALFFLLFTAYILNYRQSFANAGAGRVVTASIMLVFILLALKKYYPSNYFSKYVAWGGIVFFVVALSVSLYFLRYTLQYLSVTHTAALRAPSIIKCADTVFGSSLTWAGFKYCDRDLIKELSVVKAETAGKLGYVYDDSFSLYYLLGTRPVALIPTYYMAYTDQAILVAKMQAWPVEYLLYPKQTHFFGVPEGYTEDPRFMRVINQYQQENFLLKTELTNFKIYTRK